MWAIINIGCAAASDVKSDISSALALKRFIKFLILTPLKQNLLHIFYHRYL
jgi:hypothetical protein